jgi:Zn-finger protein
MSGSSRIVRRLQTSRTWSCSSARKVHDSEKERAKKLVEELAEVEEFVSDKYREAPAGQDEKEERVRDQLQEVMSSLRELR